MVYASIFAALMPEDPPFWLLATLAPMVFLIEAGWYALVATLLSSRGPRRVYLNGKGWFDRIAGAVLGTLGLGLVADSFK